MSSLLLNVSAINATTTDPIIEIGGALFFLMNLSEYLPYSILAVAGFVFGFFGNMLIIGAVLSIRELQSMTNMLVFNLAVADLIVSVFVSGWKVAGKCFALFSRKN